MRFEDGYLHIAEESFFKYFKSTVIKILIMLVLAIILLASELASIAIIVLIVFILSIIYDYYYCKSHKYVFYENKVIVVKGIFNKSESQVFLGKLTAIRANQSFLGQIFKYGDVFIDQLGENDFNCKFIKHPQKLVNILSPFVSSPGSRYF